MSSVSSLFSFLLLLTLSSLTFQNCGGFSSAVNELNINSSCTTSMQPVFQSGYYSFFKQNQCNSCHIPGGLSDVHFANPDVTKAFEAFSNVGPEKIDGKLADGHQGYEYSSLADTLKIHQSKWEEAQNSCSQSKVALFSQGQSLTFFNSVEEFGRYKVLTANAKQTIEFDLSQSSFSQPIPGTRLLFDIEVFYDDFSFPTHYHISNPRLLTTEKTLTLKGLTILLNEKTYQVTTYTALDLLIRPGSNPTPLDPSGASTLFVKDEGEIYSNQDSWSVQFNVLEEPE